MNMIQNPLSSGLSSLAIGWLVGFVSLSNPGLTVARTRTDTSGWGMCTTQYLPQNPWQQAAYRQALADLYDRFGGSPLDTGTGSLYEVTPMVVDIRSDEPTTPALIAEATQANAEMLATVRAAFSLQMKELAAVLRVQRPTVYAWIEGRALPHRHNRTRLQQLFRLAVEWDRLSSRPVGEAVHALGDDHKSLLDLLSSEKIVEERVRTRLRSLAQPKVTHNTAPAKIPSIRELAAAHGIRRPVTGGEDIDMLTGKRGSQD